RRQASCQPHDLNIPPGLALEPPARRDAVQIAINVELQKRRRMIARPPGPRGKGAVESEGQQIKLIDEKSDNTDKVILTNPVVEPIREQQRLAPRHTARQDAKPAYPRRG